MVVVGLIHIYMDIGCVVVLERVPCGGRVCSASCLNQMMGGIMRLGFDPSSEMPKDNVGPMGFYQLNLDSNCKIIEPEQD